MGLGDRCQKSSLAGLAALLLPCGGALHGIAQGLACGSGSFVRAIGVAWGTR